MTKEKFRRVEILEDNEWKGIKFSELELGNVIRMFEPDGSPVVMKENDSTIWEVVKAPYKGINDVLTVKIELAKLS